MKLFVVNQLLQSFAELEVWYIVNVPLYKLEKQWITISFYGDYTFYREAIYIIK